MSDSESLHDVDYEYGYDKDETTGLNKAWRRLVRGEVVLDEEKDARVNICRRTDMYMHTIFIKNCMLLYVDDWLFHTFSQTCRIQNEAKCPLIQITFYMGR